MRLQASSQRPALAGRTDGLLVQGRELLAAQGGDVHAALAAHAADEGAVLLAPQVAGPRAPYLQLGP